MSVSQVIKFTLAVLLILGVAAFSTPAPASAAGTFNGCLTAGTQAMCPPESPQISSADLRFDAGATPTGAIYQVGTNGVPSGEVANLNGLRLNGPIVGVAALGGQGSYLLAGSDGGVFALNAAYWGSMGAQPINAPIVGIATRNGDGYWLVAADGGVFAFNDPQVPDAYRFYGSMGAQPLNAPIVGIEPTPDYLGYWLVGADGGVFAFGDAKFFGSRSGFPLDHPVVAMASTADGGGYWLVSSDGGIFTYGDATFWGADLGLGSPVIAITDFANNTHLPPGSYVPPEGYCVATNRGQIFCRNSN